eukprot:IDg12851t1
MWPHHPTHTRGFQTLHNISGYTISFPQRAIPNGKIGSAQRRNRRDPADCGTHATTCRRIPHRWRKGVQYSSTQHVLCRAQAAPATPVCFRAARHRTALDSQTQARLPIASKRRLAHSRPTPTEINADASALASLTQARKSPDAKAWAIAHNAELDQLDESGTFRWILFQETRPSASPFRLHFLIGTSELILTPIQSAKHAPPYVASSCGPSRTLTCVTNLHTWHINYGAAHLCRGRGQTTGTGEFDIKHAYITETANPKWPIFVRQPPRFERLLKHDADVGEL